jgi:hypothetical protein
MQLSLKNVLLGFVAGAIATLTVHEAINFVLLKAGVFPRVPWSMAPAAISGVPQIASDAFWGGAWGAIFAAFVGGGALRGAVFGVLGPALAGVFVLVPLLTSRFPMFFGGAPNMIGSVLLILAGWGAATAILLGMLRGRG